jgi:two-component system cell cycle sensor histidine kinase/response regulator CckA
MEPVISKIIKTKKALEGLSTHMNKSMGAINVAMNSVEHIFTEYIHARKMESVELMAGGIAHDFRNFVMVVSARTDKIKDLTNDEKIIWHSEQILNVCKDASNLVNNMLTLAKSNNIQKRHIDLNGEVEGAIDALKVMTADNIRCEITVDKILPFIWGDPTQISRLIANLINNAKDALPDGGIIRVMTAKKIVRQVDCHVHGNARTGQFVTLTISDTGPGISKNILSRIFDPFFSTKKGKDHAGFGLAIVYSIVEKHMGWIDVDSVVGTGTTFTIYFPIFDKTRGVFEQAGSNERRNSCQSLL